MPTPRRLLLAMLASLLIPVCAQAQVAQLRIASVVPKNSLYHQSILELGESWRTAQGAGARFTVFTDGSQGGEAEIVRRMRIGQLQGALISVVGLRDIEPSIAALQNLPLLFRSWEEIDYVRDKMRIGMEKRFLDKGFVVIGWGDAGWVRFFSKEAAFSPSDFKSRKFFAWGSEPEQQAIMKSLGYTPVPLETGDALAAIQTLLCVGQSGFWHRQAYAGHQLGADCGFTCRDAKGMGRHVTRSPGGLAQSRGKSRHSHAQPSAQGGR